MNMFARFDKNPAMTIQDIKETKGYGRTHRQRENSIPTTNKVCGGYNYEKNQLGIGLSRVNSDNRLNSYCHYSDLVSFNF